jgi:hypothetical protein
MPSVDPSEGNPLPRKPYDPLAVIPSPEAIRERLTETLTLAERLRILLELAERLRLPVISADRPALSDRREVTGA